jgi:hypothetical protein
VAAAADQGGHASGGRQDQEQHEVERDPGEKPGELEYAADELDRDDGPDVADD